MTPLKFIVRALFELYFVVDSPGQGLLMQGNVCDVVDGHRPGLFNERIAFGLIGFAINFCGQLIDFRIAAAAQIKLAFASIFGAMM